MLNTEQLLVVLVLVATLLGFVATRQRHDVVALLALVACVVLGLTPAGRAFEGFGHPAVITVAAVLIISAALQRAGVVEAIARGIEPYTVTRTGHVAVLVGAVTVTSAFMNNVGALALFMPVAIATARVRDRPPAMFLMPLAFGSLLGGMTTLIGTPPNIIVANLRPESAGGSFGMFDYTPVGLAVAAVGLVYLILLGWRLVPRDRASPAAETSLLGRDDFLVELRLPEGSDFVSRHLSEIRDLLPKEAMALGIVRDGHALPRYRAGRLRDGDILLVRIDPDALGGLLGDGTVELADEAGSAGLGTYDWEDARLVEFLVPADSRVVGWRVSRIDRWIGADALVVALAHQGRRMRGRLGDIEVTAGDILLIQAEAETITALPERFGLIPFLEREKALGSQGRLAASIAVFAAAVVASSTGLLSTPIAFTAAVLGFLAIGMLRLQTIYDAVDWPIIVLLGALFPLGRALEDTGLAALVASGAVEAGAGLPVWAMVAGIMVVAMFLSDVVNNAATALIMAPVAIGFAEALGVSADPFLMAVAVGASSAFLTPIGHQSNTLVLGPGGYRFGDFWRVGLPLEALIVTIGTPAILLVWPA